MYSAKLFLSLLFCSLAAALQQDRYCVASCARALSTVLFKDAVDLVQEDFVCKSKLRTLSTFYCTKLYCSPEEIRPGNEYLNNTCVEGGSIPLPSYDAPQYPDLETLRKMAAEDQSLFEQKNVTKPLIPSKEVFHLTYETIDTFSFEMRSTKHYGYALFIFWGAVVAISLAAKILGFFYRKTSRNNNTDVEKYQPRQPQSFAEKVKVKINYLLLTPATIGTRSMEPYGWFTVPPLVQTLTIVTYLAINVALLASSYHIFTGNVFYATNQLQVLKYLGNRSGILGLWNIPLVWIFATRNNVVNWLTGWSTTTTQSFHRWVARLAILEILIHAICYTVYDLIEGNYQLQWPQTYWQLGVVCLCAMFFTAAFAVYGLRKRAYDVFLAIHIAFALLILVSLYYHLQMYPGTYNGWVWACAAIWALDRFLRTLRIILLNSNRFWNLATAEYCEDSGMVHLEVPTAIATAPLQGSFYYIYVLHGWTWFQSHPFTSSYAWHSSSRSPSSSIMGSEFEDSTKKEAITIHRPSSSDSMQQGQVDFSRLRFHIKPWTGLTSRLRDLTSNSRTNGPRNIRVLVEGPYGIKRPIHHFDNVVFIVAGSGITVALQHLQDLIARKKQPSTTSSSSTSTPNVHLLWVVRQTTMLQSFKDELREYECQLGLTSTIHVTCPCKAENAAPKPCGEEEEQLACCCVVPGRPCIEQVVMARRQECMGSLAVVSCGPGGMTDATRSAVVQAMKATQLDVTYMQESFSW